MRIAVVHPGNNWILSRLALEMVAVRASAPPEDRWMELDYSQWMTGPGPEVADPPVGALYFVDVQSCWTPLMETKTRTAMPEVPAVGFFTHADRDDLSMVRPETWRLDGIVHMAERYRRQFAEVGLYPAKRMTTIMPGQVYGFPVRPLRLGVCQRGGFPGKGDPFLFEALAGLPANIRCHVELRIKGSGWRPSVVDWVAALDPLKVVLDETEKHVDYPGFYRQIDYLLVPSLYEGGPMCVQEALASGVPVLAADVGFVPELLTIGWDSGAQIRVPRCRIFPPGNADALRSNVQSLVQDRLDARNQVDGLTWKSYAEKLEAFVERLSGLRR